MKTKLQKIVKILSEKYEINEWREKYTPFETLVSIILIIAAGIGVYFVFQKLAFPRPR